LSLIEDRQYTKRYKRPLIEDRQYIKRYKRPLIELAGVDDIVD
jgi:hypothetical protein